MIIILLVIYCIYEGGKKQKKIIQYTVEIVVGPSDTEFLQPLDLAFTLIYKLLP
jgi:hypothetical protein